MKSKQILTSQQSITGELIQQSPPQITGNREPGIDPLLHGMTKRYAGMFLGRHLGLSMYAGWLPVFERVCEDIDLALGEEREDFRWVQTKEKFGSARWYWTMDDKSENLFDILANVSGAFSDGMPTLASQRRHAVAELVKAAEQKTRTMCMLCGLNGHRQEHRGWYVVCCEEHFQLLKHQPERFIHQCSTGSTT